MLEEIAYLYLTTQIHLAKADAHLLFPVGRVIKCHSTCVAVQCQDVLHKHVCLANMLHHISLQAQGILVQCNEFGILQ